MGLVGWPLNPYRNSAPMDLCTCGWGGVIPPPPCPVHAPPTTPAPAPAFIPTVTMNGTPPPMPEPAAVTSGWRWVIHNVVAHPLLVLWPRLGEWLHERTEP